MAGEASRPLARFSIVSSTRSRFLVLCMWSVPGSKYLVRLQRAADIGPRTTDGPSTKYRVLHQNEKRCRSAVKTAVTRLRSPYRRWRLDIRVAEPVSALERGTFALASPRQRWSAALSPRLPVSVSASVVLALASPYQRWRVRFSPCRAGVSGEARGLSPRMEPSENPFGPKVLPMCSE